MRIAIIPMSSIVSISSSSGYLAMEDFMFHNKENYYYIFIDKVYENQVIARMEKRNIKNYKIITYDGYKVDFYNSLLSFDFRELARQFSYLYGNYPVDLFFCSNPYYAYLINKFVIDLRRSYITPVVFNLEQKTLEPKLDSIKEEEYIYYNLGHVFGRTIFLGKHDKEAGRKYVSKILNGENLEKFDSNSVVLPIGVNVEYIDSIKCNKIKYVKGDKINLFFGGRLNNAKKFADIFSCYEYIYKMGKYDIGIEITTGSSVGNIKEIQGSIKEREKIGNFHYNMNREEYLKIASNCHIGLVMSPIESFGLAFREQLYLGIILVLPDLKRVHSIMPNYPFVFKNKSEAIGLIMYIIENYDECLSIMQPFIDYIKNEFDSKVVYEKYNDVFKESILDNYDNVKRVGAGNIKLIEDSISLLKDRETFTLNDIIVIMKKISKTFKEASGLRSQSMNMREIYANVLNMGAKDLCDGPYPNFVNPKFVK